MCCSCGPLVKKVQYVWFKPFFHFIGIVETNTFSSCEDFFNSSENSILYYFLFSYFLELLPLLLNLKYEICFSNIFQFIFQHKHTSLKSCFQFIKILKSIFLTKASYIFIFPKQIYFAHFRNENIALRNIKHCHLI